jgi:hypothetical protein
LTQTPAIWPAAIVIGDDTYDLRSVPDGAQYFLSKPSFTKDADGNIIGGKARSTSEVKQITAGLIKAGKAKEIEVFTTAEKLIDDVTLTGSFSFNADLYRTATKMAANLLVAFGRAPIITESSIPFYLHEQGNLATTPAYCDIKPIRDLRPPLAHTIYVELGKISYGIVLIFGYQKIFIPLPSASQSEAFLGSLDPITGEERFDAVKPIGPRSVPALIGHREAMAHFLDMDDALTAEAVQRGAKHPPKLQTQELDLGTQLDPSWTSGTVRFLYPGIAKRER